jgi:hypothetical protein
VNSPVAGASVAAGSSVIGASVAAGSSVAGAGGCVAGAPPPQADKIMLARTSKLTTTDNLRIFLLLAMVEAILFQGTQFGEIFDTGGL